MTTATRLTFQEFCQDANQYFLDNKQDLRYGQAIVNYLAQVRNDLSIKLPMSCDPYYNDQLTNEFLYWVSENWS
jgi:hypothetical protein